MDGTAPAAWGGGARALALRYTRDGDAATTPEPATTPSGQASDAAEGARLSGTGSTSIADRLDHFRRLPDAGTTPEQPLTRLAPAPSRVLDLPADLGDRIASATSPGGTDPADAAEPARGDIEIPVGATRVETVQETQALLDEIAREEGSSLAVGDDGGITATRADGSTLVIPGGSVAQDDPDRPGVRAHVSLSTVGVDEHGSPVPSYEIEVYVPASDHADRASGSVAFEAPGGAGDAANLAVPAHHSNLTWRPETSGSPIPAEARAVTPEVAGHTVASDGTVRGLARTGEQPQEAGRHRLADGTLVIVDEVRPVSDPGHSSVESAIPRSAQVYVDLGSGVGQWISFVPAEEADELEARLDDPRPPGPSAL